MQRLLFWRWCAI